MNGSHVDHHSVIVGIDPHPWLEIQAIGLCSGISTSSTIFMQLPKGFVLYGGKTHHTHMLKLLKKIYGLKLAGRV